MKQFTKHFENSYSWFGNNEMYSNFFVFLQDPNNNFTESNKNGHMHAMRTLSSLLGETAERESEKSALMFAVKFWERNTKKSNGIVNAELRSKKTTLHLKCKNQFLSSLDWKEIGSRTNSELKRLEKIPSSEIT